MGGGGFLFENFPPFHLSRCIYLVTRRLILEKGETISENGAIASRLPLFPILDHHLVNGHTAVHKYTNTQIHNYEIQNTSYFPLTPILDHHLVNGHITVHLSAVLLKEVCTVSKARKAIRLTLSQQPRGWGRATMGHQGPPWATMGHQGRPSPLSP